MSETTEHRMRAAPAAQKAVNIASALPAPSCAWSGSTRSPS
ncbi:MAG TPA: hypothetical protein VKT30_16555 [Caulobacteraceae bacterium]|nr:hypothetical protein [Caulobacteraceae bacterium]